MSRRLLAMMAASCLTGCSVGGGEFKPDRDVLIEEIPAEIQIPIRLWNFVEGVESPVEKVDGEVSPTPISGEQDRSAGLGTLLMTAHVILEERNAGVLVAPSIRVRFPRGGGRLDLADWVTDEQGTFYIRFEFPDAEGAVQSWFVSGARARKFGDEVWGSGCKKFFLLPADLTKTSDGPGLKVNTTDNRHIAVIGGTFVFSVDQGRQRYVTQVTVTDRRKPHLFCQEL